MARMKHRHLSNRTVEALTSDRETVFWDPRLAGFGVRVYPSGARTYIAQARGPKGTRRVTLGRHGVIDAEEARSRALMTIAKIRSGKAPARRRNRAARPKGPTVAEAAARYMAEYVELRCKPSTVQGRESSLRLHILPRLGKRPLESVGLEEVLALHHGMVDTPTQANNVLDTLSGIFRQAAAWGILAEGTNPCRSVRPYRERKRERFLTEAEFRRLGVALGEMSEKGGSRTVAAAAIRLLMLTGCRHGEVLSLLWEDVDLETRELRIRDAKTGPRVVPLSPPAVAVLAGLSRSAESRWVVPGRKPDAHLGSLQYAWDIVRKRAGLPDVRLHDLRHSFASSALAAGENLPMIGKLLGHSRLDSTARYAHLDRRAVHKAAERVANSLAEDIL